MRRRKESPAVKRAKEGKTIRTIKQGRKEVNMAKK
jgi:hypothetical protein